MPLLGRLPNQQHRKGKVRPRPRKESPSGGNAPVCVGWLKLQSRKTRNDSIDYCTPVILLFLQLNKTAPTPEEFGTTNSAGTQKKSAAGPQKSPRAKSIGPRKTTTLAPMIGAMREGDAALVAAAAKLHKTHVKKEKAQWWKCAWCSRVRNSQSSNKRNNSFKS